MTMDDWWMFDRREHPTTMILNDHVKAFNPIGRTE